MKLKKSQYYYKKALELIPGQSQTFSKGPTQFVREASPLFCESAKGAIITDVDGNKYIDYMMALGPIVLGYCDPVVDAAVIKQVKKGPIFSLPHRLEVELAEVLIDAIPCAEMVRYGKNGSDVTTAAVRIARAYTGRDVIACCGYHGWQDWYIGTTTRNLGVPEATKNLTKTFTYNDISSLEKIFNENKGRVAGVILEAIGIEEPKDDFLQKVKELAHKNGAVLIFDEMKTGFHFALGGVEEFTGVVPDIAAFGKGMANGYPLAVIAGKKEIMEYVDKTFFSFTFGGEAVSLAAAIATIKEIKKRKVIPHIWKIGKMFRDGYNKMAKKHGLERYTQAVGYPVHFVTNFTDGKGNDDLLLKSVVHQELIARGNLTIGSYDFCAAHTPKMIEKTLKDVDEVFGLVKKNKDDLRGLLKGTVVSPVFRKP